jgi:dinuclear metal center YbgI/SA1388 family protein
MLWAMRLPALLRVLEALAPLRLAEPWDKVGLQVGQTRRSTPVRRALLCIDLTEPVLAEALRLRTQLIVTYHPLLFDPLKSVTDGDARGRIVLSAGQRGLAIYSPHTALDAVEGGLNDWLADGLGGTRRPIRPTPSAGQCKLVTFVPQDHVDRVRRALSDAGAGVIGHYSQCSFESDGRGTFLGDDTTNPAVGRRGQLERVPEVRVEMVLAQASVAAAVAALRDAHPYEEPAFDLVPLLTDPTARAAASGAGRVVTLDKPMTLAELVRRVKRRLKVRTLEVAAGDGRPIRTVGLCAGAGGSLLTEAGPIDAYLTGEMRHHDVLAATTRGTAILLAGHTQTERPYLPTLRRKLAKAAPEVTWLVSKSDKAPSRVV